MKLDSILIATRGFINQMKKLIMKKVSSASTYSFLLSSIAGLVTATRYDPGYMKSGTLYLLWQRGLTPSIDKTRLLPELNNDVISKA
jgi:hypothetical protein